MKVDSQNEMDFVVDPRSPCFLRHRKFRVVDRLHTQRFEMDIARPDIKRGIVRHRLGWLIVAAVLLAAATVFVMRLKPAAPEVDRSTVWTDVVHRGNMVRQVRGLGSLVPREDRMRLIPAETDSTVVRILVLPGALVKPDTIIMELANPQLTQEAQDAALGLNEAEADFQNTRVKLQGDLMDQKSNAADIKTH